MSSLKRKAVDLASAEVKKPKANASITSFFSAPKKDSSKASPAASKFDKGKWLAKLTEEQQELLKLEIDTLHESWLAHLKDDITTKDFLDLKRFLKAEMESGQKVFPPLEDVYSWSRHTPLNTVKAVIIGQDPYHNVNQAHGLCFSVRPPTIAPPSLKNIYIAIKKDYPEFQAPPKNGGLLTLWADRGVLMLNTCLTVRAHQANSHANRGWEQFTQKVIDLVAKNRTSGVVFLAWGSPAKKRVAKVDGARHCILQSVHPSPLSASGGFFDCGHFKKANTWLEGRYGKDGGIDWNLKAASEAPGAPAGIQQAPEEIPSAAPAKVQDVPATEKSDTTPTNVTAAPAEAPEILVEAQEALAEASKAPTDPGVPIEDAEAPTEVLDGPAAKATNGDTQASSTTAGLEPET